MRPLPCSHHAPHHAPPARMGHRHAPCHQLLPTTMHATPSPRLPCRTPRCMACAPCPLLSQVFPCRPQPPHPCTTPLHAPRRVPSACIVTRPERHGSACPGPLAMQCGAMPVCQAGCGPCRCPCRYPCRYLVHVQSLVTSQRHHHRLLPLQDTTAAHKVGLAQVGHNTAYHSSKHVGLGQMLD